MTHRIGFGSARRWLAAFCLPLLLSGVATAQDGEPEVTPAEVAEAGQPAGKRAKKFDASLAGALPDLDWDAGRRGPLIIVNPDGIKPKMVRKGDGSQEAPLRPTFAPKGGFSLAQLAPFYDCRILRLRGLTAFVPMTVTTVPERAQSRLAERQAIEAESGSGTVILMELLGTFTEAQWRMAGGPEGIGRGDLTTQQRLLFDRLIPERNRLLPRRQPDPPRQPEKRRGRPATLPVTPAVRNALRVRVQRRYNILLMTQNSQRNFNGVGLSVVPENRDFYLIPDTSLEDAEEEEEAKKMASRPNRLKPGDMDLDSNLFDPAVSLEGADTVGALIDRVRAVTKVEVHADARFAKIPAFTRGKSAPASEVLRAICWGLGGTFRRLQSGGVTFFLFTEDTVGVAPRLLRLTADVIDKILPGAVMSAGNQRRLRAAGERLFEAKPMRFVGVGSTHFAPAPTDAGLVTDATPGAVEFVPPADVAARLVRPDLNGVAPKSNSDPLGRPTYYEEVKQEPVIVNTASLPGPVQTLVREQAARVNKELEQKLRARDYADPDRVEITTRVSVDLWHPTMGVISEDNIQPVGPPPPAPTAEEIALPPGNRAVQLTVTGPDEARRGVAAARERGFNQLWLHLPESLTPEAEVETVKAAVEAGAKGSPVAVVAVVSLLGRALPAQPDGYSDLTSAGVSAATWARERANSPAMIAFPVLGSLIARQPDWLLPGSPPAVARVGQIVRLAEVPGLAGLAVRNAAPPYLFYPSVQMATRQFDGLFSADVGFTPAFRADFARRHRVDPVDFAVPPLGLMVGMEGLDQSNGLLLQILRTDAMFGGMRADPETGMPLPPDKNRGPEPFAAWIAERQAPNRELLVRLHGALTKARPDLRLYLPDFVTGISVPFTGDTNFWWGSWDKPGEFPGAKAGDGSGGGVGVPRAEGEAPDVGPRRESRSVIRVLSYDGYLMMDAFTAGESGRLADATARRLFFTRLLASQIKPLRDPKSGGRWDAVCVDLAGKPLDDALDLMSVWPAVPAPISNAPEGKPANP